LSFLLVYSVYQYSLLICVSTIHIQDLKGRIYHICDFDFRYFEVSVQGDRCISPFTLCQKYFTMLA